MTMVELLAYAGDLLHYRLDAVATEAFLDTARLRTSVRRHARLVDYRMHDGCRGPGVRLPRRGRRRDAAGGHLPVPRRGRGVRAARRRGRRARQGERAAAAVDLGRRGVLPARRGDGGRHRRRRRCAACRGRPAAVRGGAGSRHRPSRRRGPLAPSGRQTGRGRAGPRRPARAGPGARVLGRGGRADLPLLYQLAGRAGLCRSRGRRGPRATSSSWATAPR